MKKYLFNTAVTVAFAVSMLLLFYTEKRDERAYFASSFTNTEIVIVDAGHGGEDGGAVSNTGILEKEINLEISKKLELLLNLFGVNTDMTRRDDISLGEDSSTKLPRRKVADIKMRVEKVVNTPNSVLISIHQNSFPEDSACRGAQVFFSEKNTGSEMLAKSTQAILKSGLDKSNNREPKPAGTGIYLMNNVNCPAILVECGFLTNPEESRLLMSDVYRTKLAAGIASGFLEYQAKK